MISSSNRFNIFIFIFLILNCYFYNSLSLVQTGCIVYISNQGTNNLTCGSTMADSCISLDFGLLSCQNQSLTSQMTFIFADGVYQLESNVTIPIYNQSISLQICDACSDVQFNFKNMDTNVFQVFEPSDAKRTDQTTLSFSGITFQDLTIPNPNNLLSTSFLNVNSSISGVNITVDSCQFISFTAGITGSVFNLIVDDQSLAGKNPEYIYFQATNSNFTNNNAIQTGGVMYAGYMVLSNIIDCNFNGNSANSSSVIYSQFGGTNFTGCLFQDNTVNYQGLISLPNQSVDYIVNCSFIGNVKGNKVGVSQNSLIFSLNNIIRISGCLFQENQVAGYWLKIVEIPLSYITSSKFINNKANSLIIADYRSELEISNIEFINNTQPGGPYNGFGFISVQSALKVTINNITFINNNGDNIYTNNSNSVSISQITTSNNINYSFLVCLYSNIQISGDNVIQTNQTAYAHPIQCQPSCKIQSTLQTQMCPIKQITAAKSPNGNDKKIIFGILGSVVGIALIITLVIVIRRRLRHKHHYQRIE